jgi:hypothetical protein
MSLPADSDELKYLRATYKELEENKLKERENTFQSLAKEYSKIKPEKLINISNPHDDKIFGKISYLNRSIKEIAKEKILFILRLWAIVIYAFITFWTDLTYKCLGIFLKTKNIFVDFPLRVFYHILDKFFFNAIYWVKKKIYIYN